MNPHILAVKDAVIAKVPEIIKIRGSFKGSENVEERPITLADVLRAIDESKETGIAIMQGGQIWVDGRYTMLKWNLALPLDDQSPETIDFLYTLLVEKV